MDTRNNYFFIGLLLAVIILAALIYLPFLTPIVIAAVLAVVFGQIHQWLIRKVFRNNERSSLAALATLGIITIVVLIPVFLIAGKIYSEVQGMYTFITDEGGRSQVINFINVLVDKVSSSFFGIYTGYSFDSLNATEYIQKGLAWLFSNLDTLFTSLARVLLSLFIMFLALFYFLRDGREFKRQIIALSPLGDTDDEHIFNKLEQATYSIVAGSLAVGLIQGILTGVGFAIFGVPNPAVWGSIAAVAALIPGIGTSLVVIPGILYLLFTSSTVYAVGLLVWGLLAVGLIDNILGPILIRRGVKIHSFLILLSVLGGLAFFGPIGFVLGPLVLALLFALLEIYRSSQKRRLTNQ